MLLSEFDPCRDAVINPEMCIKGKIENFPEVTVSCFSHHLFEAVLSFFEPEEIGRVGGANGKAPVYAVTYKGKRIGFYESRVGEPACIGDYEDLLAMGMKTLILFGNCGVLDKTIEDCGIIIPTRALRDEGCSHHYAPPADSMTLLDAEPENLNGMVTCATADAKLYIPMGQLVDVAKELERINKELDKARKNLASLEGKLSNESFVSRAPEAVVAAERAKAQKARDLIVSLEESLKAMQAL